MLKKIVKKIYRLIVRIAKKVTNFDDVLEERIILSEEGKALREKESKLLQRI